MIKINPELTVRQALELLCWCFVVMPCVMAFIYWFFTQAWNEMGN